MRATTLGEDAMMLCQAYEDVTLAQIRTENHQSSTELPPLPLYFTMLGSFAAYRYGQAVPLGPLKQRMVLGALLSSPNTFVSVDALTEVVWSDEPPRTARKNLQVYVSNLRSLLGPESASGKSRIVHQFGGYMIHVTDEEVDALQMRVLAQAAHGLDPHAAVGWLRQAMHLWQGRPMHDLCGSPSLATEAEKLEHRCLNVVEDWAECEISLGHAPMVVDRLRDLVDCHPLRERLQTAYMNALHQTGRRAEALAVYDSYRRLLSSELGLDPGGAIAETYRTVLAGVNSSPCVSTTPRTSLPLDTNDLIGHKKQLVSLLDALSESTSSRVVILDGPTGSGKSAIAVRAAHLLADQYPNGRFLCRLKGSDGTPGLERTLSELSRLTQAPADLQGWHQWLQRNRALIIFDDVPEEQAVRHLLPADGQVDVVITARGRLGGLTPSRRFTIPQMETADALELLARFISDARIQADRSSALRIVRACGMVPLGIRIAGMRLAVLRHLPLTEYADRLAEPTAALDELSVGDFHVRDRLARAWIDMPAGEANALACLASQMPEGGPFTVAEAAAALGCEPHVAIRIIEDLITVGAVTVPEREAAAYRASYRLPRLAWLFAREQGESWAPTT